MQLSQNDFQAVEREICRRSLAEFAKLAWHVLEPATPLKWGWALDAICEHLEAVTSGEIIRLLMNVPPGSMKSLLTGVIWPAWEWGPRGLPEHRFLGTAHQQNLAVRDSLKCRRLIASRWYQERWPVALTSDQNAKTKFENDSTGFREAMAFTSMTGSRGDRVVLDDPINADAANSEAELENARITFTETLPTRVNNDKSAIVVVMQRLNQKDTSGVILDLGLPYVHLMIPMRYESERSETNGIGWKDPRKKDGELMFPERFPESQVVDLETILGSYGTAGQLQQRPSPRGGGLFRQEWWREYTELPELAFRTIYADTGQKTKEQNDFSVFQCWGKSKNGQAVLIDQMRGKWAAPQLRKEARDFWDKHHADKTSPLRAFKVEDKVSGTSLIQELAEGGIPIIAIQRNNDKVTRAYDVAPLIESGNVLLPKNAHWIEGFLSEVSNFPNGAHDDQVDPMMDAVSDLTNANSARVVYDTPFEAIVSENFSIPPYWKRSFAFEIAGDQTAAFWVAIDPSDNVAYAYSEHDMRGMLPSAQVASVKGRGRWINGVTAISAKGRTENATRASVIELSNEGLNVNFCHPMTDSSLSVAQDMLSTGQFKVFETLKGFERQYRTHHRNEAGEVVEGDNLFMRCLRHWAMQGRDVATVKPQDFGEERRNVADRMAGY